MIKRIALAVGSIAAAGVLALGLAAAGFGPTPGAEAGQDVAAMALPSDAPAAAEPVTQVETETVYIKPAPAPKVIHVTRKVEPAPKQQTVVRHRTTRHSGEDDEHEHEHEHEDD
ncbi:MAG: hypothetical protein U0869_01495 [Chloroflexota bacterium]